MTANKRKTKKDLIDELAESQAEYRLTIDSMTDALHVVDRNLRIVLMNRKFLEWNEQLGLAGDVIGKQVFDIFPFLPDTVYDEYKKVFETGESLTTEELTRVGVRGISTETRKIPIIEHDQVTRVITIIRDITERKRMENALRESEAKFRTLADQSPNMILINLKGILVYVNRKCEEILGYTRDECYARDFDFLSLIAPDCLEKVSESYARYLEGRLTPPYECAILTKEGRRVEVLMSHQLIDYEGETALLCVITDITDRKRTEEALRASEQKCRSFLENFHGIAYRGALDGKPIFFQGDVRRITGYTEDDFLRGEPSWEDIIHPDDRPAVRSRFGPEALASEAVGLEKEYRILKRDGSTLWVHQSVKPVRDASGTVMFVQGAVYDITDRKIVEEARERERRAFRIIADAAVRGKDSHDVCQRILTGLGGVLGFEFGTLRLYDPERRVLRLAAAMGLSPEVIRDKITDQPIDSPDYVAAHVARTKVPIFAPNSAKSEALRPFGRRLREMSVRSLISWPLLGSGGNTLGVLHLFSSRPHEIYEGDRGFFETVAELLAVVLERREERS